MMAAQNTKRWPALLLIAILALSSATGWLMFSSSGLQWLAAGVIRISGGSASFAGVSGNLLASPGAQTLIISRPDLRITLRDARLDWRPAALLAGKIEITSLTARELEIRVRPTATPAGYPDQLQLPLALSLAKLDISLLQIFRTTGSTADFSARNLTASLSSDGLLHQLHSLQARLDYGRLNASGEINGKQPFAIKARADLTTDLTGAAHIAATLQGDLKQLTLAAQGMGEKLSGSAKMQLAPYADFPIASLQLNLTGLDPRVFSAKAPKADLTLQADLRGNGLMTGNLMLTNDAPAPFDRDGLPLRSAHAHVTLSKDAVKLDDLILNPGNNSSISGTLSWQHNQAQGSADLTIHRLDPALLDTRLRAAKLDGRLKLSGDKLNQHALLSLSDGKLQLDAELHKTADILTLNEMHLGRGKALLTASGKLNIDQRQAYHLNGRLQRFDLSEFMQTAHSDLNASFDLTGEIKPQNKGLLTFLVKDSRLSGQPINGNGRIGFSGMRISQGDAVLRLGDNHLSIRGTLGKTTDRLLLDLAAPALEQLGAGFGGRLNAHASLSGNLAKPDVNLEAQARKLSLPGNYYLDNLSTIATLQGDALTLQIKASDYRVSDLSKIQTLQLEIQGSRTHNEVNANARIDDETRLTLHASGKLTDTTKDWQTIQWQGALTRLTGTGALPFNLLSNPILSLSRNHLSVDRADLAFAGGQLHINKLDWTPAQWHSLGSFTGIGLRAGIGFRPDFKTHDAKGILRLGGEWNLSSNAQSSLRVARESGDWVLPGSIALGLQTLQFNAHSNNGQLAATLTAQGTRLGDWQANVSMPFKGMIWTAQAPLTGQVHINVPDLAWLAPEISNNLKSGGKLAVDAKIAGSFAAPRLYGQLHGEDLSLALLDQGLRLQQGQLTAHFDQHSVHIDNLNFIAPREAQPKDPLFSGFKLGPEPGKISTSGVIDLNGKNASLAFSATRLPLSQRADRWIIASGNGHATLADNVIAINGSITADAGLISQPKSDRPTLSDDVVITGRQATAGKGRHLSVDATLNLGEHFYLRAAGLEARLAGQLAVRDAQGLRVTGSITARNAIFEAYGQYLTVQRGIVNFQGPLYDPGLNILAVRSGLSVEAGVSVTGSALHPIIKLVSTPEVPDVEKLSWIVLGRAPSTTGTDASLLLSAAGSILGGGSGGITGHLKQALGVDELSLRQGENTSATTESPMSSQIVTVGKRLSQRAFISYSQGVTAAAGVTKLTYALTRRVNIVTQAGVDSAIDVFYTFSFH